MLSCLFTMFLLVPLFLQTEAWVGFEAGFSGYRLWETPDMFLSVPGPTHGHLHWRLLALPAEHLGCYPFPAPDLDCGGSWCAGVLPHRVHVLYLCECSQLVLRQFLRSWDWGPGRFLLGNQACLVGSSLETSSCRECGKDAGPSSLAKARFPTSLRTLCSCTL